MSQIAPKARQFLSSVGAPTASWAGVSLACARKLCHRTQREARCYCSWRRLDASGGIGEEVLLRGHDAKGSRESAGREYVLLDLQVEDPERGVGGLF